MIDQQHAQHEYVQDIIMRDFDVATYRLHPIGNRSAWLW